MVSPDVTEKGQCERIGDGTTILHFGQCLVYESESLV